MKNYYYMMDIAVIDIEESVLRDLITSTFPAPFRQPPIFHGVYRSPKGTVHAAWYIDNRASKPLAQTAKLLSELATLMMVLERRGNFATLSINTRSV